MPSQFRNPLIWLNSCGLLAVLLIVGGPKVASGQVVQLPTFRNFSYSGGAWVPDRGTTSLGGNYRSRNASSQFGPYAGRNISSSRGGSSLTESVRIIDLQAMDDAILSGSTSGTGNATSANLPGAPGRRTMVAVPSEPKTKELAKVGRSFPDRVLSSGLTSSQSKKPASNQSVAEQDVRYYMKLGKDAEAANRMSAARVYYRLAVESMTPAMIERYKRAMAEKKAKEDAKSAPKPLGLQPNGRQQF